MKKTNIVSSLTVLLNQIASRPSAHSSDVTNPTLNPSKPVVNKSNGMTVSAPNAALGSLNAVSSEIRRLMFWPAALFQADATWVEAKQSIFITIGCSAFAVKSPCS